MPIGDLHRARRRGVVVCQLDVIDGHRVIDAGRLGQGPLLE
jgi:hypothetical protein